MSTPTERLAIRARVIGARCLGPRAIVTLAMRDDQLHATVLVDGVPIDAEIAPLIEALWARGLETLNSCQDNGDEHWVWVEFATAADASLFLNAVLGRLGGW